MTAFKRIRPDETPAHTSGPVPTDTLDSIRRGLEQAKKGMGRSVDEVFDSLERESL
jgi:hypothetical protein